MFSFLQAKLNQRFNCMLHGKILMKVYFYTIKNMCTHFLAMCTKILGRKSWTHVHTGGEHKKARLRY